MLLCVGSRMFVHGGSDTKATGTGPMDFDHHKRSYDVSDQGPAIFICRLHGGCNVRGTA